jgi:hypothetical protein
MAAQASYNPGTGVISLNNLATLSAANLEEEFFHAYQNFTYPGGTTQYAGKAGSANIEFEAKVLRDINEVVNGEPGMFAIPGQQYSDFIKNVTNNYSVFPTTFSQTQLTQYFNLLPQFIQANPGYSNDVISPSLNPTAIFSLINSSPCANK